MKLSLIFFVIVLFTLSGCYATYTGIYFLNSTKYPTKESFNDLSYQVEKVLKPYGFRRIKQPKSLDDLGPSFSHEKKYGNNDLMAISGAGAQVTVTISLRDPSITIRDISHDSETDFIRTLKDTLENHFIEYYGLRNIRFERQNDFL